MAFCFSLTVLAQQKFYTVTGKNINMRESPVTGKVIGKVTEGESFFVREDKDGWIGLWHDGKYGYVSKQFVKAVRLTDFSRRNLGDYMGNSAMYGDMGYSLATLKERDGYVILNVTDYSDLESFGGMRAQTSFTYVGLPNPIPCDGVLFTHMPYPYYGDIPVREQLTDECKAEEGEFLVVGEDGTLYTPYRTFGPQEETPAAVTDSKQTERSLFMLHANVRTMKVARTYAKQFIEGEKAPPVSDFSYEVSFSSQGDLTNVVRKDGVGNTEMEYRFTYSGNDIRVRGKQYDCDFAAEYKRKLSNYGIVYYGKWERGNDSGAGYVRQSYNFNMNGSMPEQSFSMFCPPFLVNGDGENDRMTYTYGSNSTSPTRVSMEFDYGGDSWAYDAEIRDVKTDAQGNWTERKAYVGGKLMFMEKRAITYYGVPQKDGTDSAGAADDKIYTTVELIPEFSGGVGAMRAFIVKNLNYPALCQENGIKGRVVLRFVVEKDGSIGEIKAVLSPHHLLEKEAIRVFRMMPKWKPGRQAGKPVRVMMTLPVTFSLN